MNTDVEKSAPLIARITLPRVTGFVDWLVGLWRDKGVEIHRIEPERVQLVLAQVGTVELRLSTARQLDCAIQAITPQLGEVLQLSLTEHVGEFADEMAWPDGSWTIVWQGESPRSPAQLQVLQVVSNRALTPQMRRLRLQGGDLSAFVNGGLHVRMLLPQAARQPASESAKEPAWPTLLSDGRLQWPVGSSRMPRRTYTIREVGDDASWIDIDVLLHVDDAVDAADGGAAPGSRWAEFAQPGSSVGVLSPPSGMLPRAAHHVLMADACALPAAARMARMLPQEQSPAMLLWVANEAEQAAFDVPSTVARPDWICDGQPGASALEIARVLDWLARQDFQRPETLLWVAGGLPLTQAVRQWAADQPSLAGVRIMIHTYWR